MASSVPVTTTQVAGISFGFYTPAEVKHLLFSS